MITIQRIDAEFDESSGLIKETTLLAIGSTTLVIGTVSIKHHKKTIAAIHSLFVEEPYRKQGIATLLMTAAEEIARTSGCIGAHLTVNSKVRFNVRIYQKRGYIVAYAYDDGSWLMTKSLDLRGLKPQ